jgi:hypothetical protein
VRKKPVPRRDDLFRIFPDLPRPRPRTGEERILRLRQQMLATRERAAQRIAEQREAVARVRARVAERSPRSTAVGLGPRSVEGLTRARRLRRG